jgi:hypothetical protein
MVVIKSEARIIDKRHLKGLWDTPYPHSLSQATFSADKVTSEISLTLDYNSDLYFSPIKLHKETFLFRLSSKQALLNFAQYALT